MVPRFMLIFLLVLALCSALPAPAQQQGDLRLDYIKGTLRQINDLIGKEFVFPVAGEKVVQGALGEMRKVDSFIDPASCRTWEEFEGALKSAYARNPAAGSALGEAAIKGMVKSLGDTYSLFLDAKEWDSYRRAAKGESFAGIGVELALRNNRLLITSPLKGSPAEKGGIRPGDVVLRINGKTIEGLDLNEVSKSFDGPRGSPITLGIRRKNGEAKTVTLIRETIRFDPVRASIIGSRTGYVSISYFGPDTEKEVTKALDVLSAKKIDRLILDMRGNPGGDFNVSLRIAGFLEERGAVLIRKVKKNAPAEEIRNQASPRYFFKIAVLINEGSASASEVLASSLADNNGALLVGTRSFGKGLVQSIYPLPGETALKLSTARYLTPRGADIHMKGLSPSVVVETVYPMGSLADDPVVHKALEALNRGAGSPRK